MVLGVSVTAEAKTLAANSVSESSAEPQWQRRNNRRYNRRARVVTRTRTVRIRGRLYREVWQYRYLPNGRVTTRLLSRTRIYRNY